MNAATEAEVSALCKIYEDEYAMEADLRKGGKADILNKSRMMIHAFGKSDAAKGLNHGAEQLRARDPRLPNR